MPILTIDNQQIEVLKGTNVLEAAKGLGIVIPHFCYHEALGAVGACRLCAMNFVEGPVKGIQMACMIEAKDEMVITTTDQASQEMRARVIEWLMMYHPHDCPVCDEGGECQLQDMTIAGGHDIRRYGGKKRTYSNQDLGPFICHEMNRCIQCYRCVRTYQDYCGGTDFGVLGTNQRVYFGRFRDGRLESPFSGNIVDACPTGVFTDRTFRYRTRYWDIEEAPSVCPHCSLGCAVIPGGRFRELQRVRGGVNKQTNGFFICDRARFGGGYGNHPERPRVPRVDGAQTTWPEALRALRKRITDLVARHGPGAVAFLGSPRASLEANYLLDSWAASLGSRRIAFDSHWQHDRSARVAAGKLGPRAASLEDIRCSDFILMIGVDPLNEAPMLALAVRQAVRRGVRLAVIDPRPVTLPCAAAHLPLAPEALPDVLEALAGGDIRRLGRREAVLLEGILEQLRAAERPVLIGGPDLLGAAGIERLLDTARLLASEHRPCKVMTVLAGPNSFGCGVLARQGPDFEAILNGMLAGEIKALVCLESDPMTGSSDPARTGMALGKLELLAALDYLPTAAAHHAHLFLPTTAVPESAGVYVNNEGRMLLFSSAMDPGTPISVSGGGDHPPRTFLPATPGSEPRPAWATLGHLQGRRLSLRDIRQAIEMEHPNFAGLSSLTTGGEGKRIADISPPPETAPEIPFPHSEGEGTLRLYAMEDFAGSGELAGYASALAPLRPTPFVMLGALDAKQRSLSDGQQVRLRSELGGVGVALRVVPDLPAGIALVPRLRGTALESYVPGRGHYDCQILSEDEEKT